MEAERPELVIRGGAIYDGLGGDAYVADIAITNGRIAQVSPQGGLANVVGDGIRNGDCGQYGRSTFWRSAYKPESLTQKVYKAYRREAMFVTLLHIAT